MLNVELKHQNKHILIAKISRKVLPNLAETIRKRTFLLFPGEWPNVSNLQLTISQNPRSEGWVSIYTALVERLEANKEQSAH